MQKYNNYLYSRKLLSPILFQAPYQYSEMIIIDISRDVMNCPLYPGTIPPSLRFLNHISGISDYNLSALQADLHTGTHIDAPLHFMETGKDISSVDLHRFIGPCRVSANIDSHPSASPSILLLKNQSDYPLDLHTCEQLVSRGITTIGTDALSLTSADKESAIHRFLLEKEIGIIENLDLSNAPEGDYFLVAAPIKISGAEASFCRAVLIKHVNTDSACR